MCACVCACVQSDWPDGQRLAACKNYKFPQAVATPLKQLTPTAGAEGLALMRDMIKWDPQRRPTAQLVCSGSCSCCSCCSISSCSSV